MYLSTVLPIVTNENQNAQPETRLQSTSRYHLRDTFRDSYSIAQSKGWVHEPKLKWSHGPMGGVSGWRMPQVKQAGAVSVWWCTRDPGTAATS